MDKSISAKRRHWSQIIRQKLKKTNLWGSWILWLGTFSFYVFFCRKTWIHLFWQVELVSVNSSERVWRPMTFSRKSFTVESMWIATSPPKKESEGRFVIVNFFFLKTFSNDDGTKLIFQGRKSIIRFEAVVRGGASGSFPSPSGVAE